MLENVEETVALTRALGEWLRKVGVQNDEQRADVAVDLADILAAAGQVRTDVRRLLALDPSKAEEADAALTLAANIEVQLFTELKGHLQTLEEAWPDLLGRLEDLCPEEADH